MTVLPDMCLSQRELLGSVLGLAADRGMAARAVLDSIVAGWRETGPLTPEQLADADMVSEVLDGFTGPAVSVGRIVDARSPMLVGAARIVWDRHSYPDDRHRLAALEEYLTGHGYGAAHLGGVR
jgi:hypothetical protein